MSTTGTALKTRIITVLLDPSAKTFTAGLQTELLIAGLVEVGRILPAQYGEVLTPVDDQGSYLLGTGIGQDGSPDIEVQRVEVWDSTTTPESLIYAVNPASNEWDPSDSGWVYWGGYLYLPSRVVRGLEGYSAQYSIKVFGYAPYATPATDADVLPLSQQAEQAVVKFSRVEGLELLLSNRDLFTQWQTRSGNSDISPAGLQNQLSMARADWRQYARAIGRLRSRV